MIKHITIKIFLAIFIVSLLAMSTQLIASIILMGKNDINIINTRNNNAKIVQEDVNRIMYSLEQSSLRIISDDVAISVTRFLNNTPMTLDELIKNKAFQELTQRKIFGRGYTAAIVPNKYIVVSHPEKIFQGENLITMKDRQKYVHQTLLDLFDNFVNINVSSGSYIFVDTDGVQSEKFATISWVETPTKDGERLAIVATSYKADVAKFSKSIIMQMKNRDNDLSTILYDDEYNIQFIYLINYILMLVIATLITIFLSSRIARPLILLSGICEDMARGEFDNPVPEIKTNDEVARLAGSIEGMRIKLKSESFELESRNKQLEQKAAELEEALNIAKDKTLQLINNQRNDKV